jgi:DDE superfamily endonuclease
VLNRARWSSVAVARVLLDLVVETFVATGPVVIGSDDTLERRRGAKLKAKGSYRDPVRSSHSHRVKASGLRWLGAMLPPQSRGQGEDGPSPFSAPCVPRRVIISSGASGTSRYQNGRGS